MPTDFITEKRRLAVFVLDDSTTLIVSAFWADRVGRYRGAALRAVADLTLFHTIVRASFTSSAVRVFSFRDSHRCFLPVKFQKVDFEPRIVG